MKVLNENRSISNYLQEIRLPIKVLKLISRFNPEMLSITVINKKFIGPNK